LIFGPTFHPSVARRISFGSQATPRWLMQKAVDAGGPYPENTAWCRAQLALMLFQTGALVSSEGQIKLALEEAPENPHVLAVAGRIATARQDYKTAIEFYQKSITSVPTHDALAELVELYRLTGRDQEAAAQFEQVIAFHKAARRDYQHDHARPPGASAEHPHRDGALSGHSHHPHEHAHGNLQLARFYADHNRNLDEALREARAAWTAFPNVMAADTLGWCLYQKGEFTEAGKMMRHALKRGTPDAAIHFHAGMIYTRLGNQPLAQKHLYQALSLNPHFHPTQTGLAADTLKALGARINFSRKADNVNGLAH
jgi:tetratricopeptide (TPR) repeat protein